MAAITNAQVVKWANERARPIADVIERLFYLGQAYANDYVAQNINQLMQGNANGDQIDDGSIPGGEFQGGGPADGRQIITKGQLNQLQSAMVAINAALVAGSPSPKQVADQIEVNGSKL